MVAPVMPCLMRETCRACLLPEVRLMDVGEHSHRCLVVHRSAPFVVRCIDPLARMVDPMGRAVDPQPDMAWVNVWLPGLSPTQGWSCPPDDSPALAS